MTLIAAFNIDSSPVVVGDLLLSGPEREDQTVGIPIVGDVNNVFPKGSGWSIVGLQQKVNVIADNCVIAWAGSQLAASIIIRELRELSFESALCYESIAKYFSSISPDILKLGVSFVGWVQDIKGFKRFGFASHTTKTKLLGEIAVAGTGAETFMKLAAILPNDSLKADREINTLEKAVSVALTGTGLMLQSELHNRNNLLNYFGGGYEIATFVRNKFSKIGNITFCFWQAKISGSSVYLQLPSFVLKQDYLDDALLIRAVNIKAPQASQERPTLEESLHVISPIYQKVSRHQFDRLAKPEMNSTFTCHCVLVQSGLPVQVLTKVEYSQKRTPNSIIFTDTPERMVFSINQSFVQGLGESIQKQYGLIPENS